MIRAFSVRLMVTVLAALLLVDVLLPGITRPASRTPASKNGITAGSSGGIKTEEPFMPYRDTVIVLMFHNISATYNGRGTITPEIFNADIQALLAGGYRIIPVSRLVSFLQGKAEVPPNAVVITFDDGCAGVYNHAYPVLKRNRIPATVFLITGDVGQKQGILTWPQIREMANSGLVTFGGHSHAAHLVVPTGPRSTAPATVARVFDPNTGHKETEAEYRPRIFTDNLRAKQILKRELGYDTPYFAYPYGAYNQDLDRILHGVGYEYYFTTLAGPNRFGQDPGHIYRINAGTPSTSPKRLIAKIQCTAWLYKTPHGMPAGWMPRWAEDPALHL